MRLLVLALLGSGCGEGPGSEASDAGSGAEVHLDGGSGPTAVVCTTPPLEVLHDAGYTFQPLMPHVVDRAVHPLAVCNDGTPAYYAVRRGYASGSRRWLISLEGGGSCYDAPSCQARRDALDKATGYILTSSDAGMAAVGNHGILASDPSFNPDFYDANEVRVHYCSSDSWQGTHPSQGAFLDSDPATWSFQGHAIVNAVVQDLLASGGMSDAEEVILEGESAGGAGVFYNANAVARLLPVGVRFVAISDAAFVVNLPGYDASADGGISTAPPPYPAEVRQSQALVLWNGTGDVVCSEHHDAGDIDCSFPQRLLQSQTYPMPVLVRQSEEDQQKFPELNAPDPTDTPANAEPAQTYFRSYEAQQRTALGALPSPYSAFAPNITDHIDLLGGDALGPFTFDTPVFTFPSGEQLGTAQAIHAWYADPCTQRLWIQ